MNFIGTRDPQKHAISAAHAIKEGLASDGGLFVPTEIPVLSKAEILSLAKTEYPERTAEILGKFLTDYTKKDTLPNSAKTRFCTPSKGLETGRCVSRKRLIKAK